MSETTFSVLQQWRYTSQYQEQEQHDYEREVTKLDCTAGHVWSRIRKTIPTQRGTGLPQGNHGANGWILWGGLNGYGNWTQVHPRYWTHLHDSIWDFR